MQETGQWREKNKMKGKKVGNWALKWAVICKDL